MTLTMPTCESIGQSFAGELGDRALGRRVRVADEAGGEVDGRVFGVLAVAGALAVLEQAVFDFELDLDVGVAPGLGRRYGGVGVDRRVGLGSRRSGATAGRAAASRQPTPS